MEIRDRIVELRRVPAGDLIANPRNWRTHPEAQQAALASVLADVGFADALLARETPEGLVLIDGHLRAAQTAPEAEVPVLVLDVDEAEAQRLLLTLDPLAAMAETDTEALGALMAEVEVGSAELEEYLRRQLPQPEAKQGRTDPDDLPEAVEAATKPGDLWLLGSHRLLCADAADSEAVARLMQGALADVVWTDPPYGVEYVGKTTDALTISNDEAFGLERLLEEVFGVVTGHLAEGAPFYVAGPAGPLGTVFRLVLDRVGWRLHQTLVWVKDAMVLGHSDYHYRHEDVLYGWLPGPGRSGRGRHRGTKWRGDNSETTVLEVPRPKRSREHPTMKPVELVARCLQNSCPPGGTVLDPFMGSGSTLIAAEQVGQVCYGIDIDPTYVDVTVRRWEDFTGKKAVLADGETAQAH